MKQYLIVTALSLGVAFTGDAQAAITDVTGTDFTSFHTGGAGTYGLEIRGGRDGARDWEIGVGSQTSNSGTFAQGEYAWTTDLLVDFAYDYGVTEANKATVNIGGTTVSYDFGTLELGNAVRIFVKRDARLKLTDVDGHAVDIDLDGTSWDTGDPYAGIAKVFSSAEFEDGFTMTGQIAVRNGSGSAHQVFVTAGNVAPIPVPPAIAAGLLALGALGLYGCRQRKGA